MKIGKSFKKYIGNERYDTFYRLDDIVKLNVHRDIIEKMSIYGNDLRVALKGLREEIYDKLYILVKHI